MPETVYVAFHPTKLAYWKWYLIAIIILIVDTFIILDYIPAKSLIPEEYYIYFLFLVGGIGVMVVGFSEIFRRSDTYILTNYRIVEKSGIINLKEDSISWEKISNYSLSQNFLDRLFKVGTIELWSMAGGDFGGKPEVRIKKVAHVHKIRKFLDKLIQTKHGPVV